MTLLAMEEDGTTMVIWFATAKPWSVEKRLATVSIHKFYA